VNAPVKALRIPCRSKKLNPFSFFHDKPV
jgi:hypothetical protein